MIVVEIETTGLDQQKHSIISIGAVEFEHPENQFYGECRPWEGAEIDPKALQVNKFTAQQVATQQKLLEEFLAWTKPITNKTMASQNVWFDVLFLRTACAREQQQWIFGNRYMDAHALAYEHFARAGKLILKKEGTSDINLDKILTFLGIEVRGATHNALEDAQLTAEIISRFIHGKNLLPQYKQ